MASRIDCGTLILNGVMASRSPAAASPPALWVQIPHIDGAAVGMEGRELLRFAFRAGGIVRARHEVVRTRIFDTLLDIGTPKFVGMTLHFGAGVEGSICGRKDVPARAGVDLGPTFVAPLLAADRNETRPDQRGIVGMVADPKRDDVVGGQLNVRVRGTGT